MGDGWTGINIGQVIHDLAAFRDAIGAAQKKYIEAYTEFESILYDAWASPQAQAFQDYLVQLQYYGRGIGANGNEILESATDAARTLATSNGATFPFSYEKLIEDVGWPLVLEESKGGVVGMDVARVKAAYDAFKGQSEGVITLLDSLPMNFAVFDPSGDLVATYKNKIDFVRNSLENALNNTTAKVNSVIAEEEQSILRGKTQAESELAG